MCGRDVRFEPVFARQESAPDAGDSHLVIVEMVRGDQSYVERGAVPPRHVREVVRMHGGEHFLACR